MATQPGIAHRVRFDAFELDVRAGELRKHGVRLRLRGQPLQVLEMLLERAGDVVTREELHTRIWPADTFVNFDHSLHNAISRIREVLGDSPETPRYIETLPRRGYRYIGPVEPLGTLQLTPETGGRTSPPVDPVPSPKHKNRSLVLALCAVFALGRVAWTVQQYFQTKAATLPIHSIAVLPLANLSGDPSEEFFADGMTDQLITDLAKVGSLRVVSRTSILQYKGGKKGLPEIARELNVDAIVEGSITRSGQRVRVTAQLVQARTDQHLWAETYDRDLGDILKLQDEVARSIAQQVRAQLSPTQLRSTQTVNAAAYDGYLRGRLYFFNGFTNPDSLRKAQHSFEEALQKEPNFAPAYAGLADVYVYLAFAAALPRDQAYQLAKQSLTKAVELDDSIGEAHDTLGLLSSNFDWDWDTADREFNRAIALAPSYSCAHEDRAIFLATTGQRAEALAEIAKIEELDFGSSGEGTVSEVYLVLRDYPRVIDASKRALLVDPNDAYQHYNLGAGYEATGKPQEAIPEYQKAIKLLVGTPGPAVALAHAYAAVGRRAEATQVLRDLERKSKQTSASPYTMATIYAGLGENDRAFEFLEKAYAEKSLGIPTWIKSDFLLDSLRPDPRFQRLLQRIGLKS
jgi:TolB-like protein/DNA-binding winged helix-turn-helix (wHTH) protein/tetratricopeptide (TPR) repeat protein